MSASYDELSEQIAELQTTAQTIASHLGRTPSKAALIGAGADPNSTVNRDGEWITAVVKATSRDAEEQAEGKATLAMLGSVRQQPETKATLGTTDGTGGYIVPGNRVARVIEIATATNPARRLFNVVRINAGSGAELPLAGIGPDRAAVVARGETKPNKNISLASYSASLYTLAQIYDVANQLLRQSAGAAEQLVLSQGSRAVAMGEAYYVISGSGTSEPKGINTSLAGAPAGFTSSHTASDSTVAGSVRAAVAKMIEALARRDVEPNGVLMNTGDLAHAMVQGADAAGFWVDESSGMTRLLGLPVITTTLVPTKTAIVADFSRFDLYVGEDFRVDRSSEAGDRWDKNLTGFRFETELAFNADPAVLAGYAQRVTTLIP